MKSIILIFLRFGAVLSNLIPGKIRFECGGTIISEYYVMTAAHCLRDDHPPYYVLLGVLYLNDTDNNDVKKHYIKNFTKHPEYSSLTRKNDIGLIGLRKWINFTDTIRAARLHRDIVDLDTLKKLTVASWGDTNPNPNIVTLSNELRKIEVNTKPLNECSNFYLNDIALKNDPAVKDGLGPGQYCVYDPDENTDGQKFSKDSCQGDSGGPLQYISNDDTKEATIVGIVSFSNGCGLRSPSINTRVAYYIDWITPIVWPKVVNVSITNSNTGGAQIPSQPVYVKPLEELYTVVQGSEFTLTCEASGYPYPTITWKKIYEDSLGSNVQQIGNTLKMFNAQLENMGIYQCIASNGETAESSTVIDIEPREAPTVQIYRREPQTVRIGESAMLSCRAIAGIPTPNVIWSRSDRAPLSQRVEEKYAGTILISNITFEDAGQYECRASNSVGSSSQTSVIYVQQAPIIRIFPEIQDWTITEGDELRLECSAEGSPPATVQWKRPDRNGVGQFISGVPSPFAATPQSLIQKYNANRSDEGTYICHASNEAGEDQKYITVFVQPKRADVGN
ncbi:hemicentin-2-like [Contarinia nasturtii]|uniref:hemicentin-2-like n=1 Tax=Contarinia nasturtii TaxID=265458 RepID=UPI0012D4388B|nr:hemicentin-2-like [Contarinia nasturtii]